MLWHVAYVTGLLVARTGLAGVGAIGWMLSKAGTGGEEAQDTGTPWPVSGLNPKAVLR